MRQSAAFALFVALAQAKSRQYSASPRSQETPIGSQMGPDPEDLCISLQDLKDAGFNLDDLKKAGVGVEDLKKAGPGFVDVMEGKETTPRGGVGSPEDVCITLEDLESIGINKDVLKEAGVGIDDLKVAGPGLSEEDIDTGRTMPGRSRPGPAMEGPGAISGDTEIDFSKMFGKGACPTVQGMERLDYTKLSGEWFLQMTDEPTVPELLPTCHHAIFDVNRDGTFNAIEEVGVQGKTFVAENIEGEFSDYTIEASFFGGKLQVQMEVLATDYDNFLIGYECYDNMQFALENDIEPVHIITVGIATRESEADDRMVKELVQMAIEKVPELTTSDFAKVLQGKEGDCDYVLEL